MLNFRPDLRIQPERLVPGLHNFKPPEELTPGLHSFKPPEEPAPGFRVNADGADQTFNRRVNHKCRGTSFQYAPFLGGVPVSACTGVRKE